MLRKFKISVDGTQYLVEMEEVGTPSPTPADAAPAASATPTPRPEPAPVRDGRPAAPAATPEPAPAPTEPTATGSHVQIAPMPGTILDIHVKVGDTVTANQPVMVLEAMKMENEVVAEQAGTIASVNVEKGAMVNPGDTLFTLT